MATFKSQVEGITSLSIGTTPTDDELSQFLVDGTKEVTNRIITIRPDEIGKFTTSTNDASDAGITLTGQVISVVREHDDVSILRDCSPISPGDRYAASDSTSLNYRSKYNPGFYILDGKIHTVPASAGSDNDAIVTQVYYAVNQGHSSSSIDSFPDEYEYLVVLYASLRSVHAVMGAKTTPTSVVFLDIPAVPSIDSLATVAFSETNALSITATAPSALSLSAITYTGISDVDTGAVADVVHTTLSITEATQPAYNSNAVVGLADGTLTVEMIDTALSVTDLSVTAVPPDVPSVPNFTLTVGTSLPTYSAPTTTINGTVWATAYPDQHVAISTALGKITTEVGLAKAEVLEAAGDTDSTSSGYVTALAAMKTELDKVDEICVKAQEEFDEVAVEAAGTATSPISSAKTLAIAKLTLDPFTLTAVPPDTPSVPDFTFTVSTSLPTYAGPTQTINAINWAIAYPDQQATIDTALAKVSTALNAVDALGLTKLTLDPFSITAVTPDVPTIPNFTISPATSLPDYTKLTALHDPGVPTDLSDIYDWSQSVTDIGAFAGITAVAPDTPSLTPVTFVGAGDGHTAYAITSTDSAFVTSLADISAGTSAVLTGTAPIYLPPAPPDRPDMEGAITDQDIEMLSANAQQYQTDLGAYQAEMSDAQNTFNEESTEYQANVQKDMAKAQADNAAVLQNLQKNLTIAQSDAQVVNTVRAANQAAELQNAVTDMQRIINDNTRLLSYWQQEISQYQAEVGVEVQDYQQKLSKYSQEVQTELTVWQQRRQGELSEHSQKIARFQAIMSDELNDFNTELQKYQAEVQTLLQRAQYEQQAENAANLQQYQAELGTYGAEVNSQTQEYTQYLTEKQQEFTSEVQVHQTLLQEATARLAAGSAYLQEAQSRMAQASGYAGEISARSGFASTKLQIVSGYIQTAQAYATESQALLAPRASEISEYQAMVGNSLNVFNTELQKYQAELGKELQEAQYEQQAEHAATLQQYQSELSAYQAEIASEVQEWQANTNKDLQVWQQSQSMALQEHSQRMQDALNLFNEESVEYQAEVQAETQQASINQQENMQNMQKALQIAIRDKDRSQEHQLQEAIQDTQALIAENQRKIGQYQAELGLYTAQVNKEVQDYTLRLQTDMKTMEGVIANNQNLLAKFQALMGKYSAEVQTYQADSSSEIAKYQAELQANQAEYQWLQDQYARIKTEYDSAFIALVPPGQGPNAQEQPQA